MLRLRFGSRLPQEEAERRRKREEELAALDAADEARRQWEEANPYGSEGWYAGYPGDHDHDDYDDGGHGHHPSHHHSRRGGVNSHYAQSSQRGVPRGVAAMNEATQEFTPTPSLAGGRAPRVNPAYSVALSDDGGGDGGGRSQERAKRGRGGGNAGRSNGR